MDCDTWSGPAKEVDVAEHPVGTVSHYWGGPGVAGIELSSELKYLGARRKSRRA